MTYYEMLGISQNASADMIKVAYKKMAKKYHPDVSNEKNAEERFKMINEAYRVLSDIDLREEYDQELNYIHSQRNYVASAKKNNPTTEKADIISETDNAEFKSNRKSSSGNSFSKILFVVIVIGVIWFFHQCNAQSEQKTPDSAVSFFFDNCKSFDYEKIQSYTDNDDINVFVDDVLIKMYDISLENEKAEFIRNLLSSFEYEILDVVYYNDNHSAVTVFISSCDFLKLLKSENSETIDKWYQNHFLECLGKSEEEIAQLYILDTIAQRKYLIDGEIVFSLYFDEKGDKWVITGAEDQTLLFNILIGNLGEMYWEIVDELGYEVFE